MAEIAVRRASLLANPTIDADPMRFGRADGANVNRVVANLHHFLPLAPIEGGFFEVRGHEPSTSQPDAAFFDNAVAGVNALVAEQGYVPALAGTQGPTRQVALKHLTSRVDVRDFASANLAQLYPELAFQRKAKEHAVWSQWERTAILGDASVHEAEFDGLARLAATPGAGQMDRVTAPDDALLDLDRAIMRVLAHCGRADLLVMNEAAQRKVAALERAAGFRPHYEVHPTLGTLLRYNGIRVCRNDHIPNRRGGDHDGFVSTIYVLSVGRPNGVFGITSKQSPGVHCVEARDLTPPFTSIQASLYSALVSTTDDALVALENWPVQPPFVD